MVEYDFSAIQSAVVKMLKVNMGLREGEKVLFLCDVPTMEDWYAEDEAYVQDFAIRTMMVRAAHRIAFRAAVSLLLSPKFSGALDICSDIWPGLWGASRSSEPELSDIRIFCGKFSEKTSLITGAVSSVPCL